MVVGSKNNIDTILRVKSNIDSGMYYAIQKGAIEALCLNSSWYKSMNKIYKSIRNIKNTKITDINHFSIIDILKYKKIIFTESSIKELEKRFAWKIK